MIRVEPQYLELVDYITAHPDTIITPASYLAWPKRDTSIDWTDGAVDLSTPERSVGVRLASLTVAVTLPVRPHIPSPYRRTVWLAALLDMGGAFYRTGHGKSASYVLDRAACWRRTGGHDRITLVGHRWPHNPVAPVRKLMPTPVYEPDAAAPLPPVAPIVSPAELADEAVDRQLAAVDAADNVELLRPLDPTPAPLPSFDPTPDELTAAATAAAAPETPAAPEQRVVAIDARPGGDVIIEVPDRRDPDHPVTWMVLATVKSVVRKVGS